MAEKLLMMALSPTMTEGTITKWKVAEGAEFKSGSLLCEVETDKASMDYEAPKDAVLLKILLSEGGKAAVGDPIAVIGTVGEDPGPAIATVATRRPRRPSLNRRPRPPRRPPAPSAPDGPAANAGPSAPSAYPPSSPLARFLARDLGLDIRGVKGSGPGGRVVERDVRGLLPRGSSSPARRAPASPRSGPAPERRFPVSGKRAVIARRLSESFFTAPHFYLKRRVDSGSLLAFAMRQTPGGKSHFAQRLSRQTGRGGHCPPSLRQLELGWRTILERSSDRHRSRRGPSRRPHHPGSQRLRAQERRGHRRGVVRADSQGKGSGPSTCRIRGSGFYDQQLGQLWRGGIHRDNQSAGLGYFSRGRRHQRALRTRGRKRRGQARDGPDPRLRPSRNRRGRGARFLSTLVAFLEDPGRALV